MQLRINRALSKRQWKEAYRVARMCKRGEVVHPPIYLLAKLWAQGKFAENNQ